MEPSRLRILLMLLGAMALALLSFQAQTALAQQGTDAPSPSVASSPVLEDSSFVYDIFANDATCPQIEQRLARVPLRATVLLSVESGSSFVLDRPQGAELMSCALGKLHDSSHTVKALVLQDISFLDRQEEAARRVRRLAEYAATSHGPLAGVVVDVEPYVDEHWSCGAHQERRRIGNNYLSLLRQLKAVSGPLPVEAVVPWWFVLNQDIPELLPESILKAADGVYFMVYGDEGGPVVDGEAEDVFGRLTPDNLTVTQGRTYIALATYESHSAAALETEIAQVRQHYAAVHGFAGTAIFHAAGIYDTPRVRVLTGVVGDAETPLASAQVECSGIRTETNICGQFTLKGLPEAQATLTASKAGYEPKSVRVELAPPGRLRELPPIVLSRKKQ